MVRIYGLKTEIRIYTVRNQSNYRSPEIFIVYPVMYEAEGNEIEEKNGVK